MPLPVPCHEGDHIPSPLIQAQPKGRQLKAGRDEGSQVQK